MKVYLLVEYIHEEDGAHTAVVGEKYYCTEAAARRAMRRLPTGFIFDVQEMQLDNEAETQEQEVL